MLAYHQRMHHLFTLAKIIANAELGLSGVMILLENGCRSCARANANFPLPTSTASVASCPCIHTGSPGLQDRCNKMDCK